MGEGHFKGNTRFHFCRTSGMFEEALSRPLPDPFPISTHQYARGSGLCPVLLARKMEPRGVRRRPKPGCAAPGPDCLLWWHCDMLAQRPGRCFPGGIRLYLVIRRSRISKNAYSQARTACPCR
jgi:hypothetical protein